ncbi:MAG: hypothetical protein ACFFDN_01425 [Candidatus Hodarchaeota archaeon]
MSSTRFKKEEVTYAKHYLEFLHFYTKHRNLCDEISGLKKYTKIENGHEKEISTTKQNFDSAIKRLDSFIIDNSHYMNKIDKQNIKNKINEIYSSFYGDTKYTQLASKEILSRDEEILFNKLYFKYILKCFYTIDTICEALQDSVMLNTNRIRKAIKYFNADGFYENLAKYRSEVCDMIANMKFKDTFISYKKVLGYHFTYRIMVEGQQREKIDVIINKLTRYIFGNEFLNLIYSNNEEHLINDKRNELMFIKECISKIYVLTNESMSKKNILPKVDRNIKKDLTLI